MLTLYQWRIQDFPRKAAPTPKSAIIFQFFCRKLHENERIWTPGGRVPGTPLGSANAYYDSLTCNKHSPSPTVSVDQCSRQRGPHEHGCGRGCYCNTVSKGPSLVEVLLKNDVCSYIKGTIHLHLQAKSFNSV